MTHQAIKLGLYSNPLCPKEVMNIEPAGVGTQDASYMKEQSECLLFHGCYGAFSLIALVHSLSESSLQSVTRGK